MLTVALWAVLAAGPSVAQPAGPGSTAGALAGGQSFAPYALALASLAGWALLMPVLAFLSSHVSPRGRSDSGHPVRDYGDPAYRRSRAHLNAVENAGPYVAATVAAVLAGAPPFWVNLLAALFLVARIAMAAVHVGTENQTLRSLCFGASMICLLFLAALALVGAVAS